MPTGGKTSTQTANSLTLRPRRLILSLVDTAYYISKLCTQVLDVPAPAKQSWKWWKQTTVIMARLLIICMIDHVTVTPRTSHVWSRAPREFARDLQGNVCRYFAELGALRNARESNVSSGCGGGVNGVFIDGVRCIDMSNVFSSVLFVAIAVCFHDLHSASQLIYTANRPQARRSSEDAPIFKLISLPFPYRLIIY